MGLKKVEISNKSINNLPIKPLLRWAGGKNWLIKHLPSILPKTGYKNYHEPFLGGGSVFLSIHPENSAFLSDLNNELIITYSAVKDNPEKVIKILKTFKNDEDFYYKLRGTYFADPIKIAARFIYLNQTSFNGIYRVNLKGEYNVPFGFRKKNFCDPNNLRQVSLALRNAKLFSADFEEIKSNIKKRDLVFLDPPYPVSHNGNGFIKYNDKLFTIQDLQKLSTLIDHIKRKGGYYILTNSAHQTIEDIFSKGDRLIKYSRANLIGGLNAERGQTTEYIFTNTIL